MCLFIQISTEPFKNLHYVSEIVKCHKKYSKFLHDDFTSNNGIEYILSTIPFLWAVCTKTGEFMGFVSIDNFAGNKDKIFSAEITACFHRKAWGIFTKYCAKFFLKKCFDELGLYKIKANIFPDNHRVRTLLKLAGFKYEATLFDETVRNGKLQNIEIYSIKRNYYYKDEVNYYDR